jgi:polysaccharide deacetylase family protein (PEP-CTERM system associated)
MSHAAALLLSMDVEDWPQSTWDRSLAITHRAADNTMRVLDILATHKTRITMFVLGKFAERFPGVVARMYKEGHEVASHGFGHVEVFRQTQSEFVEDVTRSITILEQICGTKVEGYRAPDFSIVHHTLWALDALADLGLKYDSSIFPIRHKRYGIPQWRTLPARVQLSGRRTLVELPIATATICGTRVPVAGGGYHRLLPSALIQRAVKQNMAQGHPFVAYCHPYEFDNLEFRELPFRIPIGVRLHQGLGRRGFQAKFENLIRTFPVELYRHAASRYQELEASATDAVISGALQSRTVDRQLVKTP